MEGGNRMEGIKISDLPAGIIVWKGHNILGVTQATLPKPYYECYCRKIRGNELDYELIERSDEVC